MFILSKVMRKKINQSGQSTIEFIVAFIFGVSLIFMVFNSALNYSTGYLVHYATFMASRTYLVADSGKGNISNPETSIGSTQEDEASQVYNKYRLDIFKIGSDTFKINPLDDNGFPDSQYLTVGGRTIFDMRIDAVGKILGQTKLELVSESFLGHEPTRAQCANRVCVGITGNSSCENVMDTTLYDNGC